MIILVSSSMSFGGVSVYDLLALVLVDTVVIEASFLWSLAALLAPLWFSLCLLDLV